MKLCKAVIMTIMLISALSAKANIVTLDFEAIVVDGSFAGQSGIGSISYDTANIPLMGEAFLGFPGGGFADFEALTAFSFSFLGQSYSQLSDAGFPDLPLFSVFDSFADSLDFFVEDGVGVDILEASIIDFQIFGDFLSGGLRDSNNGFDFEIDMFVTERGTTPVSAPFGSLLLLFGCASIFCRRR